MIEEQPPPARWLNRNVLGAGLTSFLADACYETATSILAPFPTALGAPPVALGVTEGFADALSSFVKLGSGWYGDRFGHRKAIVVGGYALTALATACFAFAFVWPMVLLGRAVAWLGKGIRGPLRNAILAESVPPADRGKVFGFHRAGDTLGAIVGPLLGALLLGLVPCTMAADGTESYRIVFFLTLIPGLGSALTFALLVRERHRVGPGAAEVLGVDRFSLPRGFRSFLVGVGVFGAGDFAPSLLLLASAELLAPRYGGVAAAQYSALLYAGRNLAHALAAFPVALADRVGRHSLLALGYALGAGTIAAFGVALAWSLSAWPLLILLFALSGIYIAIEETLEPALAADLVPDETVRGTAYGVLGAVNGVGDFVSSVAVGLLWTTTGPALGFAGAALLMVIGAVLLLRVR